MAWNDGLTPGQPAYAIAIDGAGRVRVLAGPGTGKSFAMNRRVVRLLENGIAPDRILAVTFTRMAAEDLVREIRRLDVEGSDEVHAGTLHGFCFRILGKSHVIELTGRNPRPLAKYERRPLIADLKALGLGKVTEIRKKILAYEAGWARLQHEAPGVPDEADLSFESTLIHWLRFHRAMLIGELVPFAYHYLRTNGAAPELSMFDEVLVDEYQDLNKAEQEVINLMASKGRIVVIGDDDQSIYSFKYAHPSGIQEFGSGDAALSNHALEECHRSPAKVVEMANRLISRNLNRLDPGRFLSPIGGKGEGIVSIQQFENLAAEADWLRDEILAELQAGVPAGQIIVLSANRFLARPLLGRLKEAGVPVRFCFEEHQLDNESAAHALAVLGWVANLEDRVVLRYLIGEGSTSWLASQWRRIVKVCREEGKSPLEVLDEVLAGRQISGIHRVKQRYEALRGAVDPLFGLLGEQLVSTWLGTVEEGDELEDLFVMAMGHVEENPEADARALYDGIVDQISQPEVPAEVADIRIMSLHKSKGLSANVVVVSGVIEGAVPRHPSEGLPDADQDRFVEEQRRLFYVAITRVKAEPEAGRPGRLIVTSTRTLPTEIIKRAQIPTTVDYGGYSGVIASRFLSEVG